VRRLLVILSTAVILSASAGSARAGTQAFIVLPSSLNATISRQIDADRHALAQAQQRQSALGVRLRAARAKLAAATDPFEGDDAVGELQTAAASAAAHVAGLNAAIRRLRAALQPVRLPVPLNTASTDAVGWDAVAVAEHYLGVRYLWGGSSPQSGFDCSGFVKFVYAQLGLTLAHYAATQYVTTPHIDPSELEAGDLVFFEPRGDGPGHVGIYIGEGQLIEAPHTGDVVKLAPLAELSAALGFVGATRPSELLQPLTTA
jgi:peptidoglycan DL-endopeptidase CwlO